MPQRSARRSRTRQGYAEQRTALINRRRGLLAEFGIVLSQKAETIRREVVCLLEDLPEFAAGPVPAYIKKTGQHLGRRSRLSLAAWHTSGVAAICGVTPVDPLEKKHATQSRRLL